MKSLLYIIFISLVWIHTVEAQHNDNNKIYRESEATPENLVKPTFVYRNETFQQYVQKRVGNVRPTITQKIFIEFIVEKDGSLSNITFSEATEERTKKKFLKVFKKCPKWQPGLLNGKPVRVRYMMPIMITVSN